MLDSLMQNTGFGHEAVLAAGASVWESTLIETCIDMTFGNGRVVSNVSASADDARGGYNAVLVNSGRMVLLTMADAPTSKILIVDDDPDVVTDFLSERSYSVATACNGAEARRRMVHSAE